MMSLLEMQRQADSYAMASEQYGIENPLHLSAQKAYEIHKYVASRYLNQEREPLLLPFGQCLQFYAIAFRASPYLQLLTYTQYGKSNTVSIAVLERVSNYPEDWIITAPSKPKGDIIMRALQGHIFDNEYTKAKFIFDGTDKSEYLLHSKSKNLVTFSITTGGVGRVRIVSADAKNKGQGMEASMGEGAPNVVCDESALLNDVQEAGIARMLGGHADSCYIKIGNPFHRNHFFKSWNDPDYAKVFIPWEQGVTEGRIAEEKIIKAKDKPKFDVLYDCKFPKEDDQDLSGYNQLIGAAAVEGAQVENMSPWCEECVYGLDVAGGGSNYATIVRRTRFGSKLIYKKNNTDPMKLVTDFEHIIRMDKPKAFKAVVDAVGVGEGTYYRMKQIPELAASTVMFKGGGKPPLKRDQEMFANNRAMVHWRAKKEIESGHQLEKHEDWNEYLTIKYKILSDKKVLIMSKIEMKALGHESPDVSDASTMTFFVDIPKAEEFEPQDNFYNKAPSIYDRFVPR